MRNNSSEQNERRKYLNLAVLDVHFKKRVKLRLFITVALLDCGKTQDTSEKNDDFFLILSWSCWTGQVPFTPKKKERMVVPLPIPLILYLKRGPVVCGSRASKSYSSIGHAWGAGCF